MVSLKHILSNLSAYTILGNADLSINQITFDSRKVNDGDLFIAVPGTVVDGHKFIDEVIKKGAKVIVCEMLPEYIQEEITYITVQDSSKALSQIACAFYDHPSKKLKLIGITGTNGKTTTVTILYNLFRALGYKTGLLSTVENKIDEEIIPATHTTPDPIQLNSLLAQMAKQGSTHCFMEVSSHALIQNRVEGIHFSGGIFSNITHDHLDYHKTFDAYIAAKKLLFDHLPKNAFALYNVDDKRGTVMVQNSKAKLKSFALRSPADFKTQIMSDGLHGLELNINGKSAWFKLSGKFNAYNLTAIYGAAILLGEDEDEVLLQLSNIDAPAGRFQKIVSPNGKVAIVDYAHTPDAVENVLKTIKELANNEYGIITVIGCGGNRDSTKRPLMAEIAAKYSSKTILTSDNPRNEDPEIILDQMMEGIKAPDRKKVLRITDRKEAIRTAFALALDNEVILVAGKGHENYQEIKGVKHPFDDAEIIRNLMLEAQ